MKKLSFYTFTAILSIVLLTITSCSKEENNLNKNGEAATSTLQRLKEDFKLGEITVGSTTTIISESFFNLGVIKIKVVKNESEITYLFETTSSFVIQGKNVNLSTKEFVLKDNFIYEKSSPNYSISILNNEYYIETVNYEGFLKDYKVFDESENSESNLKISLLLLFLNEIKMDKEAKLEYTLHVENFELSARGCSIANTKYVYGIGLTQAAATANLEFSIDDEQNGGRLDCRRLGTTSITNWGGFYTAMNTYCCDGTGGSGGSW